MNQLLLTLVISFLSFNLCAQDEIHLNNPSLEDTPRHSKVPEGWDNCGFEEESPVDVHPSGDFGVYKTTPYGDTYVGMVVRDNETWECFGQELQEPLQADLCYRLAFVASQSKEYVSLSRLTNKRADYNTPCIIRLWAGYVNQDGYQLLAESDPVDHTDWKEYELTFTPEKDYDYIFVEAYYAPGTLLYYNGNVLIDYFSPIVPCALLNHGAYIREFEDN
jgi:hypothetical protein